MRSWRRGPRRSRLDSGAGDAPRRAGWAPCPSDNAWPRKADRFSSRLRPSSDRAGVIALLEDWFDLLSVGIPIRLPMDSSPVLAAEKQDFRALHAGTPERCIQFGAILGLEAVRLDDLYCLLREQFDELPARLHQRRGRHRRQTLPLRKLRRAFALHVFSRLCHEQVAVIFGMVLGNVYLAVAFPTISRAHRAIHDDCRHVSAPCRTMVPASRHYRIPPRTWITPLRICGVVRHR